MYFPTGNLRTPSPNVPAATPALGCVETLTMASRIPVTIRNATSSPASAPSLGTSSFFGRGSDQFPRQAPKPICVVFLVAAFTDVLDPSPHPAADSRAFAFGEAFFKIGEQSPVPLHGLCLLHVPYCIANRFAHVRVCARFYFDPNEPGHLWRHGDVHLFRCHGSLIILQFLAYENG